MRSVSAFDKFDYRPVVLGVSRRSNPTCEAERPVPQVVLKDFPHWFMASRPLATTALAAAVAANSMVAAEANVAKRVYI